MTMYSSTTLQVGLMSLNGTFSKRNVLIPSLPNVLKVLSRQHAEMWTQDGLCWIRDIKSSNGTYLNGKRLSPEGMQSEAFAVNEQDILEFGVDIIHEDANNVIYKKISCKIVDIAILKPSNAGSSSLEKSMEKGYNKIIVELTNHVKILTQTQLELDTLTFGIENLCRQLSIDTSTLDPYKKSRISTLDSHLKKASQNKKSQTLASILQRRFKTPQVTNSFSAPTQILFNRQNNPELSVQEKTKTKQQGVARIACKTFLIIFMGGFPVSLVLMLLIRTSIQRFWIFESQEALGI